MVKRLLPPMLDLADTPVSLVCQLPHPLKHETGIIAARFDMLIPAMSTHLTGQREHATVFASHNSLLVSGRVAAMVGSFLQHGHFDPESGSG